MLAGLVGSQVFSGHVDSATQPYGGNALNEILIQDTLSASVAGGAVGLNVVQLATTTNVTGARTALQSTLKVFGPTGNTSGEYSGFETYCIGSGNDNGTPANYAGVVFGINTVAQLGSTCTFWGGCVGYELDISVAEGASVQAIYGLHISTLGNHAVNGSLDDVAFHVSGGTGQTAFWETGIGFGANTKPTAFGPRTTFIKAFPDTSSGTLTVANGIDLSNGGSVSISGNAWVSNGATISGSGNVTANALTVGQPGVYSSGILSLSGLGGCYIGTPSGSALSVATQTSGTITTGVLIDVAAIATHSAVITTDGDRSVGLQVDGGTGPLFLNCFNAGDVLIGSRNIGTAATTGFLVLPVMAGKPTATPSSGTGAAVFNSASQKLNIFSGGTWYSSAAFSVGAG